MISVDSIKYSFPKSISEPYNITVTCIIHPDSSADKCVVMAMANDSLRATPEGMCICESRECFSNTVYTLLYFAWEDQRQKQHFMCHKILSMLYEKYSTVVNEYSTVALISLR